MDRKATVGRMVKDMGRLAGRPILGDELNPFNRTDVGDQQEMRVFLSA